ncbi:MarR family transcriptional regulator [Patescibacteria group bacterium]|nr:MarR family transcriptional regulator [Patescibacteria group bacterium]
MNIIHKIQAAAQNRKTYRIGLLQAKAYRVLKHYTSKVLSEYKISTIEWAFLGLLYDAPKGMRSSVVANELGVEAPFITQIVKKLEKTDFILEKEDEKDSRAKILSLTKEGVKFVDITEVKLREVMRPLVKDVSPGALMSYIEVMQSIIKNQ